MPLSNATCFKLLVASVIAICTSTIVSAQPTRAALVIGNSMYPGASRLDNPVRDASAMAGKLRDLGFTVDLKLDQTAVEMRTSIARFYKSSEGKEGTLLYFAGHGKQARGVNVLLPIDVALSQGGALRSADDLLQRAVALDEVVDMATKAGSAWSLVIVDACRDDVRIARSWGGASGFAPVAAPSGTLLAFATAPGALAKEGAPGTNGLYTTHLLAHLATPDLPVELMFKRVRAAVIAASTAGGNPQIPWESTSLVGDLSLAPGKPAAAGAILR